MPVRLDSSAILLRLSPEIRESLARIAIDTPSISNYTYVDNHLSRVREENPLTDKFGT